MSSGISRRPWTQPVPRPVDPHDSPRHPATKTAFRRYVPQAHVGGVWFHIISRQRASICQVFDGISPNPTVCASECVSERVRRHPPHTTAGGEMALSPGLGLFQSVPVTRPAPCDLSLRGIQLYATHFSIPCRHFWRRCSRVLAVVARIRDVDVIFQSLLHMEGARWRVPAAHRHLVVWVEAACSWVVSSLF